MADSRVRGRHVERTGHSREQRSKTSVAEIYRAMGDGQSLDTVGRMVVQWLHGEGGDQQTLEDILDAVSEVYGAYAAGRLMEMIQPRSKGYGGKQPTIPDLGPLQQRMVPVGDLASQAPWIHHGLIRGESESGAGWSKSDAGVGVGAMSLGSGSVGAMPVRKGNVETTPVVNAVGAGGGHTSGPTKTMAVTLPGVPKVGVWPAHPLEVPERTGVVRQNLETQVGQLWFTAKTATDGTRTALEAATGVVKQRLEKVRGQIQQHQRNGRLRIEHSYLSAKATILESSAVIRMTLEDTVQQELLAVRATMDRLRLQLELDAQLGNRQVDQSADDMVNQSERDIVAAQSSVIETMIVGGTRGFEELEQEITQLETTGGTPHGVWLSNEQAKAMRKTLPQSKMEVGEQFVMIVTALVQQWRDAAHSTIAVQHQALRVAVANLYALGRKKLESVAATAEDGVYQDRDRLLSTLDKGTLVAENELLSAYSQCNAGLDHTARSVRRHVGKQQKRAAKTLREIAQVTTGQINATLEDVQEATGRVGHIDDAAQLAGALEAAAAVLGPKWHTDAADGLQRVVQHCQAQSEQVGGAAAAMLDGSQMVGMLLRQQECRVAEMFGFRDDAIRQLQSNRIETQTAAERGFAVLSTGWSGVATQCQAGIAQLAQTAAGVTSDVLGVVAGDVDELVSQNVDRVRLSGLAARDVAQKKLTELAGVIRNHLKKETMDLNALHTRLFREKPECIRAAISYSKDVLGLNLVTLISDWEHHHYKARPAVSSALTGNRKGTVVRLFEQYDPKVSYPMTSGSHRGYRAEGDKSAGRNQNVYDPPPTPDVLVRGLLSLTAGERTEVLQNPTVVRNITHVRGAATVPQQVALGHMLTGNVAKAKEALLKELAQGMVSSTVYRPSTPDQGEMVYVDPGPTIKHHVDSAVVEKVANEVAELGDWDEVQQNLMGTQNPRLEGRTKANWFTQLQKHGAQHQRDLLNAIILQDRDGRLAAKLADAVKRGDIEAAAQVLYSGQVFSDDPRLVELAKSRQDRTVQRFAVSYPDLMVAARGNKSGRFSDRSAEFLTALVKQDIAPVDCLSFALDGFSDWEALAALCVSGIGEQARLALSKQWVGQHGGKTLWEGVYGDNWGANLSGMDRLRFVEALYQGDTSVDGFRNRLDNLSTFANEGWLTSSGLKEWVQQRVEFLEHIVPKRTERQFVPDTLGPQVQMVYDTLQHHVRIEEKQIDEKLNTLSVVVAVTLPFVGGWATLGLSALQAAAPIALRQAYLGDLYSLERIGLDIARGAPVVVDSALKGMGNWISSDAAHRVMVLVDSLSAATSAALDPRTDRDKVWWMAPIQGLLYGGTRDLARRLGTALAPKLGNLEPIRKLSTALPQRANDLGSQLLVPGIRQALRIMFDQYSATSTRLAQDAAGVWGSAQRGLAAKDVLRPK